MKRSILAIAVAFCAASFSFATVAIQKEAKAKDPKVTCKSCHTAMPCTKTNLTDEGKKWIPAKK
ncbi:hypothetical protein [Mesoterricola silvestris]|uniref:Cytochrome c domain-containing protein n=1 Tax=Mesoterricola silvestris TaxID=2927979 RepID=A0AA48GGN2_9BACT|nr:hypothetical protein [Mesoterricola silvestris]BDU72461.1 hypothetical protein METEAL_16350 [Mesoterricola silvestris]